MEVVRASMALAMLPDHSDCCEIDDRGVVVATELDRV